MNYDRFLNSPWIPGVFFSPEEGPPPDTKKQREIAKLTDKIIRNMMKDKPGQKQ